jgi:hypothetical protein
MRTIICNFPDYTEKQIISFEVLGILALIAISCGLISGLISFSTVTKNAKPNAARLWLLTFGFSIPLCFFHLAKVAEYQFNSMWYLECRKASYLYGWYIIHILGAVCFINFHTIIYFYHRKVTHKTYPKVFGDMVSDGKN